MNCIIAIIALLNIKQLLEVIIIFIIESFNRKYKSDI